jgi:hypothetical protein
MAAPASATPTLTPTPDALATAVAGTLTAMAPTGTATSTPEQPGATPTLVFSDDFCDPGSGWPSGDTGVISYGYVTGMACSYQIRFRAGSQTARVKPTPGVAAVDYDLEANVSMSGAGAAGLLFGVSADRSRYYVYAIDSNHRYGLYYWDGAAWHAVIAYTASTLVDPDFGNRLRVESRGSDFGLYIDGNLVNGVNDGRSHAGEVGLYAESVAAGYAGVFNQYRLYR